MVTFKTLGKACWLAGLSAMLIIFSGGTSLAGTLDPPGGDQSMPSLTDIYDRLSGHEVGAGAPTSPAAGPQATGHTLKEVLNRVDAQGTGGPLDQPFPPHLALVQRMPYPDGRFSPGVAIPTPRFSETDPSGAANPGLVRDHLTGLEWLKHPVCMGSVNFAGAGQGIADLNAGLKDATCFANGTNPGGWRIPTLFEILSLFDFRYYNPVYSNYQGNAKGTDTFDVNFSDYYWTSVSVLGVTSDRYVVTIDGGSITRNGILLTNNLLPVRSGNFVAPVAAISAATPVSTNAPVSLNGSSSSLPNNTGGATATYKWKLTQVPAGSAAVLSDPTLVNPTFVADRAGSYIVQLVVNFGTWDSPPATKTIVAQ